ncbi:MAG TPA: hypothetical protein VFU05_12240 [Cyclobacteriaceae bacterium]|nr:hypothetical protein [Cyclobacteriaceae bacterium]
MKTLIVYYSFTQNNEKLANFLQKKLNCDIVPLETVGRRNGFSIFLDLVFNRRPEIKRVPYYLRDYDHVIFLAPIWAGKIAMPMKSFLINEKGNISDYSFITLCGGGNPKQKENIRNELSDLLERAPLDVVELWVSKLLLDKKENIKPVSSFKVNPNEIENYQSEIENFIREQLLVSAI